MEIREYREYREEELLSLYASVGWTAYTQHPETLRAGFANSPSALTMDKRCWASSVPLATAIPSC